MARLARVVVPGMPHHVTQRGNRRQSVFFSADDRQTYLQYVGEAAEQFGVSVWAWCLMTNHVHFVAVPEDEDALAKCFGRAHTRYTRMINFRKKWRGYLWQGRFASSVMDDAHLYHGLRYVERNPVRARMARVPWSYAWSSAAFRVGRRRTDPLVRSGDRPGRTVDDWRAYLREGDDAAQLELIRRETPVGRPLGDARFIRRLERRLGIDLFRRPPGRPRKRKGNR